MAQTCEWIASDAGRHAEAERICWLGMSAAHAVEDRLLAGNVAGSPAYQRSNTGRSAEAVDLAQAALDEAGVDAPPKVRALYLATLGC